MISLRYGALQVFCIVALAIVFVAGIENLRGVSQETLPAKAVVKVGDYDQLAIDAELGRLCDCSKFVDRLQKVEKSIEELAREDDALDARLDLLAAKMDELASMKVATLPPVAKSEPVKTMQACPDGTCPLPAASVPVVRSVGADPVPGHWTYPGTIDGHLTNDHGVSVAGLSTEEQLTLHDRIHEGTARGFTVSRSVVRSAPVRSFAPAYSSCPAGGCPQGYASSRTVVRRAGLFRR